LLKEIQIKAIVQNAYGSPDVLQLKEVADPRIKENEVLVRVHATALNTGDVFFLQGSLWTAAILHASHNIFIQGIFDPLTRDTGFTTYITTEFGVGLAVAAIIIAVIFRRQRASIKS